MPRFCRHAVRSSRPRFIVDGGSVTDPRVQAHAVVVRDIASQALCEIWRRHEGEAVDGIALHRVEERLHVRVVGDLPWPVHALHEAERGEPIAKGIGRVLDAAVAVEDDAGARAPIAHGVIERREGEAASLDALRLQPIMRRE